MPINDYILRTKVVGANASKRAMRGLSGATASFISAAAPLVGVAALFKGVSVAIEKAGQQELAEKKLEAALGKTSNAQ